MDPGRLRHRLRRRGGAARRRPRLPGPALRRGASATTCSGSSSRTRMRTISARSSSCGRACARRSTRRASPSACSRPAASASPARRRSTCSEIAPGQRIPLGPFDIEYVPVAHSIPESNALAIRTPLGLVLHTGDWKLDDTPFSAARPPRRSSARSATRACSRSSATRPTSCATAAARARAMSPSAWPRSSRPSPHRVAVTTFASNVARIRAVARGGAGLRPRGRRGRARHGPGHRRRARMRLPRRPAGFPPARRLRLPAARQGRRPAHRLAGRAARRARPHRRRRASRDRALAGRPA